MHTRSTIAELHDLIPVLLSKSRAIRAETAVVLELAREVREILHAENREADERLYRALEAAADARHMAHCADPTSFLPESSAWVM
jgi:hypothetical protein